MGSPAHYSNRPDLKAFRQNLRNGSTSAERMLWQGLKGRGVRGLKFRRQHSVGRFVLDFYCLEERLAIELDGGVHADPFRADYDAEREAALERMGITILRLTNESVVERPQVITEVIALFIEQRRAERTTTPNPS